MKGRTAVAALVLAVGASVVACDWSERDADYAAVCVDPGTGLRVSDSYCGPGDTAMAGFAWWYLIASQTMPGVGVRVSPYAPLTSLPAGSTARRGVPYSGFRPSSSTPRPSLSGRSTYKAPASQPRSGSGTSYRAPAYKAPSSTTYRAPSSVRYR